jgi:hypothetical protein
MQKVQNVLEGVVTSSPFSVKTMPRGFQKFKILPHCFYAFYTRDSNTDFGIILNQLYLPSPLAVEENFKVCWNRLVVFYNFAVGQKLVGHRSRSSLVTSILKVRPK